MIKIFDTDRSSEEFKKMYEMYNEAEKLLNSIGFKNISVRRITFNNRFTSTFGSYISNTKTIEISKRHFACGNREDVMNTIIHEISHNICEDRYGEQIDNNGHTREWFEIANYISKNTKYKIEQFSDLEEDKSKIISFPKYFHRMKCNVCGYEYTTISKFEDPNKLRKRKCILCQSNYKLIDKCSDGDFKCIKKRNTSL